MTTPSVKQVVIKGGRAILHIVLIGGAVCMILPFLWMVFEALKPNTEIYSSNWIPSHFAWGNFVAGLTALPFGRYFLNSALITLANVVLQTFSSAWVAYGFSRFQFRGRNILFMILVATMMVPYYVTLIPTYLEFSKLGWVNSFLPLIIPGAFGVPFYVFMMRQFLAGISREVDEAAKVDGCGPIATFFKIILPQAKPVIVTIAIFTFLGTWNDFLNPLVFINSQQKYTVALGLQYFVGQFSSQWNLMMVVALIALVPCILLFFFAQKYFTQGLVISASEK